jgi:hypothetical protein
MAAMRLANATPFSVKLLARARAVDRGRPTEAASQGSEQ